MVERSGLLTPKQVARAIGVSEASVKRWCDRGFIEMMRTAGGHRRLQADSVVAFLKKSGHVIVQPEVLALPSTSGHTERIISRDREQFAEALSAGQQNVAWQTVSSLQLAGHSLTAIADDVIAASLSELKDRTTADASAAYRERRANEICLRVIHDLREELPALRKNAPVTFVAALDGETHSVTVALAELILRSTGWNSASLGIQLPFETLKQAIRKHAPRLLCIQIPGVRDEEQIVRQFSSLHRVAKNRGTSVVVIAASTISDAVCDRMTIDGHVRTFSTLEWQAKHLRRKR